MKALLTVGVVLVSLFVSSTVSSRGFEVKSFYNPMYKGYQLDWCLEWGEKCGKDAAEAWCRWKDYDRAVDWKINADIGARTPTKVMRGERICDQHYCDGFEWVSCERFDDRLWSVKACLDIGNKTGAGVPACQGEQGHHYGKAGRSFKKGEKVWILLRLRNLSTGKHTLTTAVNRVHAGKTTGSTKWAQTVDFSNNQKNWWLWFATEARDSGEWTEHIHVDGVHLGYVEYCVDCISPD